jgi:hypothetical protein
VNRTRPGCDEKRPAGILLQHSGGLGRSRVAHGIRCKPLCDNEFLADRQHLAKERVARVPLLNPPQEGSRDKERERPSGFPGWHEPLRGEVQFCPEDRWIPNGEPQFVLPRSSRQGRPLDRGIRRGADRIPCRGYNFHPFRIIIGIHSNK